MTHTLLSRRQWLTGLVAAGLSPAALAWGQDEFRTTAAELQPFRGLNGQDLRADAVALEGRWPAGLAGRYYRNGPGLLQRAGRHYEHWFDGDGLVQAWTLGEGRISHRARFVQTEKFRAEQAAGRFLLPAFGTAVPAQRPVRHADSVNVANTSVLLQGEHLYALWEGGSAHELDPLTLETRGVKNWSDELRGMPFSAHPKVEPDGTVWNFGTAGGRLALYRLSAQGQVLRHGLLDVQAPPMLHDFAVSQRYLVFLMAPITLDRAALQGGAAMLAAMRWQAAQPTRVLVVEKADFSRWQMLEMPAANVFHFGNAWDEGGHLRVDYVQGVPLPEFNGAISQLMQGRRPERDVSTPRVLDIDLARGRLALTARDEAVEFPVVDPRVVAQRHRFVWYPTALDTRGRWGFNGLMRLDLERGTRERYCYGDDVVVEEHVMVPRPGSTREGEGWLLGMGYDTRRERSFLDVFDAQALAAGPIARAWLPYAVPYGFHGRFYAA